MTTRTPTQVLVLRRAHLDGHRRAIIGRSLAAALASALPVPLVDDWLVFIIQSGTFRKLARDHQVDLDEDAVRNLVYGQLQSPSVGKLAATTVVLRVVAKSWRKLMLTYLTTRRVHTAGRYFLRATLFDHYCARLHVGLGLDGESALALGEVIDEALASTPGGLSRRMLRRSIAAAARASVRAPVELVDIATGGVVRRLLERRRGGEPIAAAEAVDAALEQQMAIEGSFLARASAAVESQLSAQGNPYVEALIDNFERLWRQRREP